MIGYPDERLGERVCAIVIPATSPPPPQEELKAFVRERGLAKQFWPELVRFVKEFPQTPAGKVRKNELRQRVIQGDAVRDE